MKIKKILKISIICLLVIFFIIWTVSGILANEGWLDLGNSTNETYEIQISGSTTCLTIISEAADDFMDMYDNYDIRVSGGGSSVGVTQVGEGTADIGMASRDLKSTELSKYPDLKAFPFALDGIALIVDKGSNAPSALTMEQLVGVYNGTYTNWNDVGGSSGTIVLMGRDSASGTRVSFEEITELDDDDDYNDYKDNIQEYNSNGGVHDAVAENENAIGYVGLGYVDSDVEAVAIDGVEPSIDSVKSQTYPISRALNLITDDDPEDEFLVFINFLFGPEGQKIVLEEGFITLY